MTGDGVEHGIAVVGLGGVFPGALSPTQFWQNIVDGRNCLREVPDGRWIVSPDKVIDAIGGVDRVPHSIGGYVDAFDLDVDGLGIQLDNSLIQSLDPLFAMGLHAAGQALQDAGADANTRDRAGVVMAAIALPSDGANAITRATIGADIERQLLSRDLVNPSQLIDSRNGKVCGLPAALIARAFGLGGGAFTLDAACASSLYAVKLACDELASGRRDLMVAGGLSRPDPLYTQMGFAQLQALSPSGVCAPFDATSNGLIVGEGAGALILKRLDDAVAAGDQVYAVIRGIGLSNDIGGSLLAPDSEGQLRAMQHAYRRAGWRPDEVDLIECHGTGTPRGDAAEIRSLMQLWEGLSDRSHPCSIGSVKSMIGHLLTAAGAAGLIKTVLALHQRVLPPSANYRDCGDVIPLRESPFRVQTTAEAWPARTKGACRKAGVSAFGFGGINGHVLLEEWENSSSAVIKGKQESADHRHAVIGNRANAKSLNTGAQRETRGVAEAIAVVGVDARFGSCIGIDAYAAALFNGEHVLTAQAAQRQRGIGKNVSSSEVTNLLGGFINELPVNVGEFKIPPNEIAAILPQQLLMLQSAAAALDDAGMPRRAARPRLGAIIGMAFDMETTHFHLRWWLHEMGPQWASELGVPIDGRRAWVERLIAVVHDGLNAPGVVGNLGGMIASRVAREFGCGGPSFGVSSGATSALHALDIAMQSLRQNEIDACLVGGVDFAGDGRLHLGRIGNTVKGDSHRHLLDANARTTPIGDGAGTLIVKRLSDAQRDGDQIYAVFNGVGHSTNCAGNGLDCENDRDAKSTALRDAAGAASIEMDRLGLLEYSIDGDTPSAPDLHRLLGEYTSDETPPSSIALSSATSCIGAPGAATGMASLLTGVLALTHKRLPVARGFESLQSDGAHMDSGAVPIAPQYWYHDRARGVRTAGVIVENGFGGASAAVLSEYAAAAGASYSFEAVEEPQAPSTGESDRESTGITAGNKRGAVKAQSVIPYPRSLCDAPAVVCLAANDQAALVREVEAALSRLQSSAADVTTIVAELAARAVQQLHCRYAIACVIDDWDDARSKLAEARQHLINHPKMALDGRSGIHYTPDADALAGKTAFVFPGSGNHYLGMGQALHAALAPLMARIESRYELLATELMARWVTPWRSDWRAGWQDTAVGALAEDMRRVIFAQVTYGMVMHDLLGELGLQPDAVIGYSLGESTSLFATRTWPEADEMLRRMMASSLFKDDLYGSRHTLQQAWQLNSEQVRGWQTVILARPAEEVRRAIVDLRFARLLIVNTPSECVVGGMPDEIDQAAQRLGCRAIPVDGVPTVHLDAVRSVEDAYRALHVMETNQNGKVDLYSCHMGRRYDVSQATAADSITAQAIHGFDFTRVIESAYADGVRRFIEVGPQASCTRMIRKTLAERPALVVSAGGRPEEELPAFVRLLATCCAYRLPVRLDRLYPERFVDKASTTPAAQTVVVAVGGAPIDVRELRGAGLDKQISSDTMIDADVATRPMAKRDAIVGDACDTTDEIDMNSDIEPIEAVEPKHAFAVGDRESDCELPAEFQPLIAASRATAAAHQQYFAFAQTARAGLTAVATMQAELVQQALAGGAPMALAELATELPHPNGGNAAREDTSRAGSSEQWNDVRAVESMPPSNDGNTQYAQNHQQVAQPMFPRDKCMEFAIGKLSNVLGPMFAEVDSYPVRVRLPDAPLMLVDRILTIDGEMGSLTGGRIVTEHDVCDGAWYLDGGCTPVCITVEAGQADLFLSSYLGIDLAVKGTRSYRLLDATVTFHRALPRPGETIHYDIQIDRFVKQGETYLFFFRFDGTINGETVLTMRDGCAGFFTDAEIENSGGIILTKEDTAPAPGQRDKSFVDLVPMQKESYNDEQVAALRRGDLATCFGPLFANLGLLAPVSLPDGRMKLFDRVLELDPTGGRFGLGRIRAEADIYPDDWFLTCHFIDDMTMPGTLMYECCVHALRFFLIRMGWVGEAAGVSYQPLHDLSSALKCRGPVTQTTKKVIYEVDIKEIGYNPKPYVIADALMLGDGRKIVRMTDMSLEIQGLSREAIEGLWQRRNVETSKRRDIETSIRQDPAIDERAKLQGHSQSVESSRPILYDKQSILEYSNGRPSVAFGEPYRVFDEDRVIARLPGPPFQFMDRVLAVDAKPFVLKPTGWVESEYDVPNDAWYFAANRQATMPFAVILEAALQPCGWLAAYCGSALRSDTDLSFRNLGGTATLHREIHPDVGTLKVRVRMTNVNEAGGMIIQDYDMQLSDAHGVVYEGVTHFGFFSKAALAQQLGVRDAKERRYTPTDNEIAVARRFEFEALPPIQPEDAEGLVGHYLGSARGLHQPAKAFLMLERVDALMLKGGPNGLGFVNGSTGVNPEAWFFKAHFYQDPVWPGSLGLESFLQLLKAYAIERWGAALAESHSFEAIATGMAHTWVYRGQVIPKNSRVDVEAVITHVDEGPEPLVMADGFLVVDGIPIYEMKDFALRLVRR